MEWLDRIWSYPLFKVGSASFTIGTLAILLLGFAAIYLLSLWLKHLIVRRLLRYTPLDRGAREAIGTLLRYIVIFFGTIVLIQSAGIDLTALHVLLGAVGVGIGFGLQNIANNFISGIIILLERPIQVGDRVEIRDINGQVVSIGARSTVIVTNDNITMIVPNSFFISEPVINWTRNDPRVRFRIPIGVAYGTDLHLVERLLFEVADKHPDVLKQPPPVVRLMGFGDSAIELELRVWSTTLVHQRGKLISDLNFAIYEVFRQNGIEIPFPQRDVHIRSGTIQMAIDEPSQQ